MKASPMEESPRFQKIRAEVDKFAKKHPDFDELGPMVNVALQIGYNLEEAYQIVKAMETIRKTVAKAERRASILKAFRNRPRVRR